MKETKEGRKKERTKKGDSLSILQMPITVWKTELEKQARSLRVMPLGRPSLRGLCWGMKTSRASAWMPYLSRVQAVRSSHRCFCSHHSAWSDQSRFISAEDRHKKKTDVAANYHTVYANYTVSLPSFSFKLWCVKWNILNLYCSYYFKVQTCFDAKNATGDWRD